MRKGTKIAVVISTAALTFGLWMMVLGKDKMNNCHHSYKQRCSHEQTVR